jgi:chromosome transmission fidelity protein 4
VIKIVNTNDMTQVLYLRDQPDSIKHVTFDRSGTILAASCKNGIVYFYSLSSEEPRLLKAVDGLIKPLETDSESSSRIEWHPSGAAFGAPNNTRGIYQLNDSEAQLLII